MFIWFLVTTGFICLLMMCVVERGGRSYKELLGPLKAHSHGHCSAHSCNPRLREKELSVGYLIQTKER